MSRRIHRPIHILILSTFLMSSCSGPGRAKRYLSASSRAYDQARQFLLSGDLAEGERLSAKSRLLAEKAAKILANTPLKDQASRQFAKSDTLASIFTDPVASIRLWLGSLATKDFDLLFFIFDHGFFLDSFFSGRSEAPTQEQKEEFKQAFLESYRITMDKYGDYLSSWEIGEAKAQVQEDDCIVDCQMVLLGSEEDVRFWLKKEEGAWRVVDFSASSDMSRRASDTVRRAGSSIGEDVDIVMFFKGKGVFEALMEADHQGEDLMNGTAWQNPLVGHYVRTLKAVTMNRDKKDESIPEGTLLMVVQQDKTDKSLLFVRTTEAAPEDRAIGRVRLEETEHIGTDESEIWGTDSAGGA